MLASVHSHVDTYKLNDNVISSCEQLLSERSKNNVLVSPNDLEFNFETPRKVFGMVIGGRMVHDVPESNRRFYCEELSNRKMHIHSWDSWIKHAK